MRAHHHGTRCAAKDSDSSATGAGSAGKDSSTVDLSDALPAASHDGEPSKPAGSTNTVVTTVFVVLGALLVVGAATVFKDSIRAFLVFFIDMVDDMGALGMLLYVLVYTGLEVLAVPAIPLTMTAGAIFGVLPGTAVVSAAGTLAATLSFLIARYVARDRFLEWALKNKRFRAVNRVIKRDGFKVVTLLRLSPLLPLAASNYLYGLTSVPLQPYVLGTWLGMLPGTLAYVAAGHVSKAAFLGGEHVALPWWQICAAAGVSVVVVGYIGTLAKQALAEMNAEEASTSSSFE